MRKSIQHSVLSTARDLNKSGIVNEVTLREIESLCLPEIKPFSKKAIVALRKRLRLSQAAFARVLNTSVSSIQKWESGAKRPSGLALKLLNIADEKGLDVLC